MKASEEVRSIVPVIEVALELTNVAGRMGHLEEEIIAVLKRELGEKYGIIGGKARCDGYGPNWYEQQLPSADDDEYEERIAQERIAAGELKLPEWEYPTIHHVSTEQIIALAEEMGISHLGGSHDHLRLTRMRLVASICKADQDAILRRYPAPE